MTTAADLISETKRHLQSFQREPMNKLASTVAADATSLSFTYDATAIQAGAHLQIDLELVYVWSVDTATKTAVVERAQLGSVAATHTAGAVVTVNPKFPDFAILKALNDELADLSSPVNGLYAVRALDLIGTVNGSGYDLAGATDFMEILDLRQSTGALRSWMPVTNYEVHRNTSAKDFPSGLALTLHEGVSSGRTLRVLYKASFTPLTSLADDVEVVSGLPSSAHDIPPMGAAVRMVAPREIKRNFTEWQGEPRRANEVPPGAVGNSMRLVAGQRQNRITAEASKLMQQYPDRGFIPTGTAGYPWRRSAGRRW